MKSAYAWFSPLGLLIVLSVQSQAPVPPASSSLPAPVSAFQAIPAVPTPAQQLMLDARRQIAAHPDKANGFEDLALADLKRARETEDAHFLADAEQAIANGLKLDPKDFQLQKTQVELLLARHQYMQAREKAVALNRQTPDDVMTYGYLAEADIALGDYPSAEKSAQWMLNMRPNNLPGLLLASRLRVVYGDPDGALELLNLAYSETSPADIEELARIANQIASIQLDSGDTAAAASLLERTDQLFPGYPATLENLGRARVDQHRFQDAIALLEKVAQQTHSAHAFCALALAQEAAGKSADAAASNAKFKALAEHPANPFDDSQRELILLYASNPATVPEAVALARQQIALRHDVWTLDAYAWALYKNGDPTAADVQEQKAIAVGVQSARIFDHAGHIAQKLNRADDAARDFELSLKANASSDYSADARSSLGRPSRVTAANPLQVNNAKEEISASAGKDAQAAYAASLPVESTSRNHAGAFEPVPAKLLIPLPTDTDRLVHNAQALVARNPKDAAAYSALGAAHFQRARETGDVSDYQLAEESLTKSLDLDSTDFSADEPLGTMAEVCMGEHRFTDALHFAQRALALGSGDVSSFAIVGDAYADMGEYEKAAEAYARLTPRDMTLSPRAAYARDSRIAYLKFISGDTPAAIALMKTAVAEGTAAQLPRENLAWLYYELGEFYVQAGDPASADDVYLTALTIHPGDYRAMASLGKLRANNGRFDEAILLYQKAIAVVPMPIFVAELGDLYARAGKQAEAKKQYQLVEYIGLLGHINQVLHNRDLAVFYADHDIKLPESLDLARKELEVRQDVYTWDALAWALYKNGQVDEAQQASDKALKFGTRDSLLLFHAGMIAAKGGRGDRAKTELSEALQINPHFHLLYAQQAQQQVAQLTLQAQAGRSHGL
jgi:tetratricopeptide (TPR) repeat protein